MDDSGIEEWKTCPSCGGNGLIITDEGAETCPVCEGEGEVPKEFHEKLTKSDRQFLGGAGGALFGAAVGGPAGALIGGLAGAILAGESGEEEEEENEHDRI